MIRKKGTRVGNDVKKILVAKNAIKSDLQIKKILISDSI